MKLKTKFKNLQNYKNFNSALFLGLAVSLIMIIFLLATVGNLQEETEALKDTLRVQATYQQNQNNQISNEINTIKSLKNPIVTPEDKKLVFPELAFALPYNDVTKTLQYIYDDGINMNITSTLINDSKERQMSCSWLVRVNTQNDSAYSPWEESAGSVKLDDGRTLYIVAAKAYKNHEASTEECASEVWTQITPLQVADEFKKAESL